MPDPIFADARLAALYDPLDPDRGDLDAYVAMVDRFGAHTVLDVGCGTGVFALLLAARGIDVIAVDPAAASLAVARTKPGADRVRWLLGDASGLAREGVASIDLATMTANVAQVFLTDQEWMTTLTGIRSALRPGGTLVFETRVPAARAWERWTRAATWQRTDVAGVGPVEHWVELTDVVDQLVSFTWTFHLVQTGEVLTSTSTLRFRERDEVERSLAAAGFDLVDVLDAPDRPGLEHVFVARRPDTGPGEWSG